MGFSFSENIPVLAVFLQGLLSFFSPCVLPLVPLYISYLAGGTKTTDKNGILVYPRGKVMLNTVCFVIGISFTFFLLGFSFTAFGRFFSSNQALFAQFSGILMILLGLYQLGVFGRSRLFSTEHRFAVRLDRLVMNPLVALVLGFTFSFAWTPCVGPALGSVLLMVSSSGGSSKGLVLIGVYTLGFVLPFLAVGLFTTGVLAFFKRHQSLVRYTVKIGAALLILMGVMTATGFMNGITSYLSTTGGNQSAGQSGVSGAPAQSNPETPATSDGAKEEIPVFPASDFTLTDQFGESHTLSDYRGKTVFLNFWATWCGPCQQEMPDIQALYEAYGSNKEELIVLGIANPKTDEHPHNQDKTQPEVEAFLTDNGYTFPVAMDTTGDIFFEYGIQAFPTTIMIDADGNIFGYVVRALTGDMMESIVQQTMTGQREPPS